MSNYELHMLGGDAVLAHHGVLGMKWGVRRYQNPDGSLTPLGEKRYYTTNSFGNKELSKAGHKQNDKDFKEASKYTTKQLRKLSKDKSYKEAFDEVRNSRIELDKKYAEELTKANKREDAPYMSRELMGRYVTSRVSKSKEQKRASEAINKLSSVINEKYKNDKKFNKTYNQIPNTVLESDFGKIAPYKVKYGDFLVSTAAIQAINDAKKARTRTTTYTVNHNDWK